MFPMYHSAPCHDNYVLLKMVHVFMHVSVHICLQAFVQKYEYVFVKIINLDKTWFFPINIFHILNFPLQN